MRTRINHGLMPDLALTEGGDFCRDGRRRFSGAEACNLRVALPPEPAHS
jgi:hypothetical protein